MLKKILFITFCIVLFFLTIILVSEFAIFSLSKGKIFSKIEEIPTKKVGLLLGTGKYLPDGRQNLFYVYRINAMIELYNHGKIKKILISGDNSTTHYDEPTMMKNDLIQAGIPESNITLDFAGFRTLDSIVRAKKVFGADDIIIISQKFHIIRAVVIGKFYGIKTIGYEATAVPLKLSPRVFFRERLARVKMWVDIVTQKQPKFLGEQELIK